MWCQLNYLCVSSYQSQQEGMLSSLLAIWFLLSFLKCSFQSQLNLKNDGSYNAMIWLQPMHIFLKFYNPHQIIQFCWFCFLSPHFTLIHLSNKQVQYPLKIMSTSQATKWCWPIHSHTYHQYLGEICFSKTQRNRSIGYQLRACSGYSERCSRELWRRLQITLHITPFNEKKKDFMWWWCQIA